MKKDADPETSDLEKRTVEAHRSYIAALAELEEIELLLCRSSCKDQNSLEKYQQSYRSAEERKEKLRVVFRDLCNELGYIPQGYGIGLPEEPRTHERDN